MIKISLIAVMISYFLAQVCLADQTLNPIEKDEIVSTLKDRIELELSSHYPLTVRHRQNGNHFQVWFSHFDQDLEIEQMFSVAPSNGKFVLIGYQYTQKTKEGVFETKEYSLSRGYQRRWTGKIVDQNKVSSRINHGTFHFGKRKNALISEFSKRAFGL